MIESNSNFSKISACNLFKYKLLENLNITRAIAIVMQDLYINQSTINPYNKFMNNTINSVFFCKIFN